MRGCDARDQLRSGTCDWRVMLLVCAIALVGQVGLSMVSDDWPVGQVRLPSTGGEEVVLSIHAGGSSGGVVSEMNESMYVARLGQPIAGRSSGGGLQLIHGAIGTYRVVGLAKPVQLFAEAVDGYHVHLDWVDTVAGETGFKIERRYSDGVYEHIGSVGANEVIYEDKDVLPGEFYIYRVRAVMDELAGGYSNEASAATPLAGDVNMDGVVSIIDLARLASNFNKIVNSWEDGDLNGDGIVNISDLAKLASRFGEVHEDWGKLPDGSISVIRRYTIIDLGTLGGIESVAMDVNKDLKVVGYSLTTNSRLHSFEWEDGLLTDTNPEAALSSRGYAVNEGGVVAGQHRQLSNLIHATLWSTSGVMSWVTVDEDLLFGRSINDDGVMVGYAAISHPSEGLSYRAFKVENQIVQWLIDDESEKTWAMDVNNDGLAAVYELYSELFEVDASDENPRLAILCTYHPQGQLPSLSTHHIFPRPVQMIIP